MNDEAKHWVNLHEKMNNGNMEYNPNYYVLDTSQDGAGDVKLVTPTQAQVDQAKVQLKRKLSVADKLPPPKRRKTSKNKSQSGGKKNGKKRVQKKSQRGGKRSRRRTKKSIKRLGKRGKSRIRKRSRK